MTTELRRLLRFGAVGAINTLLTLAAFLALTHGGIATAPASALAFGAGATNGYILNRRWTFHSERHGPGTVARYVAVQALGAAVSAGGVALITSDLAVRHLLAEALVLPVATLLTYTLSRRVVFGVPVAAAGR
ncbi:MAG TPA: GtrA family protein [Baekduia sp.]